MAIPRCGNIRRCPCCTNDGNCCTGVRLPTKLCVTISGGPDQGAVIPVFFDPEQGLWVNTFLSNCGSLLLVQVSCLGQCFFCNFCCVPNPVTGCCQLMFCATTDEPTCRCSPVLTMGRQAACGINPQAGCPQPCMNFVWSFVITETGC